MDMQPNTRSLTTSLQSFPGGRARLLPSLPIRAGSPLHAELIQPNDPAAVVLPLAPKPELARAGRKPESGGINPVLATLLLLALWLSFAPTALAKESACTQCHVTGAPADIHVLGPHASLDCVNCHEKNLSPAFHGRKASPETLRDAAALRLLDPVTLTEAQVLAMTKQCAGCHASQYSEWKTNAHSMTYSAVFLNQAHNQVEQINHDCLRCHGMFFEGTVRDIVTPLETKGPWKLKQPKLAERPSIPCLACHRVHEHQEAFIQSTNAAASSTNSSLTGYYDRREQLFFPVSELPHPKIALKGEDLKISADPLIRVCYQCHAPSAYHQAGTGDDRTPRGVHAGLSCMDCHPPHALNATASCANCHPKISHCGQDPMKMDTTFFSKTSAHNIHTVACIDCHPQATPKPK
jgi:hypothetical protein